MKLGQLRLKVKMFYMLKISWHHANGTGPLFKKKKKVILAYVEQSLSSSSSAGSGLDAILAEAGLNSL